MGHRPSSTHRACMLCTCFAAEEPHSLSRIARRAHQPACHMVVSAHAEITRTRDDTPTCCTSEANNRKSRPAPAGKHTSHVVNTWQPLALTVPAGHGRHVAGSTRYSAWRQPLHAHPTLLRKNSTSETAESIAVHVTGLSTWEARVCRWSKKNGRRKSDRDRD